MLYWGDKHAKPCRDLPCIIPSCLFGQANTDVVFHEFVTHGDPGSAR